MLRWMSTRQDIGYMNKAAECREGVRIVGKCCADIKAKLASVGSCIREVISAQRST